MWYAVCLAALTAIIRSRGLVFCTPARPGSETVGVEARAVDLFCAALADNILIGLPQPQLGNANIVANYHEYYQTLIKDGTDNGAASNAYLTASYVPVKTKCTIMKYRTGTLYNQKHVVWFTN